jgi:DNA-binding response OmpR family regulator
MESGSVAVPEQKNPPPRILVVEDDADTRRLNAEVLINSGYEVDAAEDGAVAWEALQKKNYDLLVTDNEMPKVTGVELIKKLHAVRKALPVIMATGVEPKHEFMKNPWLHPAAVLQKPYTTDEFLETVRAVLHAVTYAHKEISSSENQQGKLSTGGWKL